MNEKLAAFAERKQKLVYKAALQRTALAQCMEPLRRPLVIADKSLEVVRYFQKYPVLMVGVSTLTGVLIRRLHAARFTALLQTGWSVFQLVRDVRESIRKD
jgi:putative copper export protein